MAQTHSNTGDNVGGDKIKRQINMGDNGTYIEKQVIGGTNKIPRALTKPPFQAEVFLGREDDLNAIKNKLFSGDNMLLLVNGQGGVGKTTIAAKYYITYEHEYAHTAWVLSEKSIANALVTHLAEPLEILFEQNDITAVRLDKLLRGMANLDKPCLLVIDNANEVADLEQNYLLLRGCSNFHLLLTSRITEFQQAQFYPITGLPEGEALALFETYYKKPLQAAEKTIFSNIYHAVGGNTLVVEILAKNLYLFNRLKQNYSLSTLLTDLQTRGLLALSQSQIVAVGYQAKDALRKEKPEDIIAAMYDLSKLSREETALLSVFAVLPAESIGFETLESLLPNTEDLEDNALSLAQKGWIEWDKATTSFKCNPVVQEITRKKNPILRGDCEMLIDSLIDKLDYEGSHITGSTYEDATIFARYAETVVSTFSEPNLDIAVLCERIGTFHSSTGNLNKTLLFFEKCKDISKSISEIEPNNAAFKNDLAISYEKLGETHAALGNLDKALLFYEDETQLFEQLYESYPLNVGFKNGLAISYEKLGETHAALGNLDKALQFYEDFNLLEKQLYESYPSNVDFKNGLAISYEKLGETHAALGNLDKALQFYEDFAELLEQLYEGYPSNVGFKNGLAISYSKLGETHAALGNLDKALQFYEDRSALGKQLYESYPSNVGFKKGLAISYERLGSTHAALGNLDKALQFYEDYNLLDKQLYESYPSNVGFKNGLAISYSKLGETHAALGNLDKALQFYEDFAHFMKQLYESYPLNVGLKNGLAISYEKLGSTHAALGNLDKALQFYQDETQLFEQLYESYPSNVGFKNGLAISYEKLGETHTALGNLDKALQFYEDETQLFEQLYEGYPSNVGFKNGLAISYWKLGNFYRKINDKEKARIYFLDCEKILVELVKFAPMYKEFQDNLEEIQGDLKDL